MKVWKGWKLKTKIIFGTCGVLTCAIVVWGIIGWVYLRTEWLPQLVNVSIADQSQVWPLPTALVRAYLLKSEYATNRAKNSNDPIVAIAVGSLPPHPLNDSKFNAVKPILVWSLRTSGNIDGKVPGGFTALTIAATYGQSKIVQLLLQSGADVNAKTLRGSDPSTGFRIYWTPLTFALCGYVSNKNPTYAKSYRVTIGEIRGALRTRGIRFNERQLIKETQTCRISSKQQVDLAGK